MFLNKLAMSVDNKQYNTEREESMADQTRPEIEAIQLENKARKRQKDNLNVAIEATFRLDKEHLEKLAEHIDQLYEERYKDETTNKFVL
jgi:hypothetical protein